jgi:hypothetical protein
MARKTKTKNRKGDISDNESFEEPITKKLLK